MPLGQPEAQYSPLQSNGDLRPRRVDPRQPLPSSFLPSQDQNGSPVTNAMERTTSQRRGLSGAVPSRGPIDSFPQPPAAPEVPKAPPLSYRQPQANGIGNRPALTYPGSFAQRAAILTGKAIPPDPATIEPESPIAPRPAKTERRASLNRPIGGVYSEIQQHKRDSYTSTASPTSPRRISNPQNGFQPQLKNSISSTASAVPKSPQQNTPKSPLSGPRIRQPSTDLAQPRNNTWAADRSPLQKLEVKLSDISKEEKRARVEEAEHRLRESKLAAQRETLRSLEIGKATPARRASASNADARIVKPKQPSFDQELDVQHTQNPSLSRGQSMRTPGWADKIPARNQNNERGVRFEDADYYQDIGSGLDGKNEITRISQNSGQPALKELLTEDGNSRHDSRRDSTKLKVGPRRISTEQQRLYDSKAESSQTNDTAEASGGRPDPVPVHAGVGRRPASKHALPPQTLTGIQARQRIGFGADPGEPVEEPTHRRQHLSDVMHHGRTNAVEAVPAMDSKSRRLDEWRHGGVARLVAADFLDNPAGDGPWWEKGGSGSRRRSQRTSVGGRDAHQDGPGKLEFLLSTEGLRPRGHLAPSSRPFASPVQTRLYVPFDGASRAKKSLLSRLKGNFSTLSHTSESNRPIDLYSVYSYSCPHLADHDPFHNEHVCEPYLSKELTKSMRSIRTRLVPALATFSPPLYLKCGPLLRYTGMKRDKLENQGREGPQSSERQTWRGSVMIVTADVDSNYDPAPTLRLFPEPMEKLPPPHAKTDTENGEELPVHYLDPVAGLPKLSRTGKTVYVKPVDDLQHGKDLSRFETEDDGLFEDFRTAAVPTAYGTPEYRHGQNGPPTRQGSRGPKPKRGHRVRGVRLHAERGVTFWRFNLEVELQSHEARIAYSINSGPSVGFWVPAKSQTMNIMFHSCNGFSLSVK